MENHPIPQNVTGFQFKLIGEMTLKQFGYLAGGVILAWLFLSLPIFGLIKVPLGFLFAITGVSFAFLPIEGRPMDAMFFNYIRALFASNQFVYQKVGGEFVVSHVAARPVQQQTKTQHSEKLQEYLKQLPKTPQNKFDEKEIAFLNTLSASFIPVSQTAPQPIMINTQPTTPHIVLVSPKQPVKTTTASTPAHTDTQNATSGIKIAAPNVSPQIIIAEEEKPQEKVNKAAKEAQQKINDQFKKQLAEKEEAKKLAAENVLLKKAVEEAKIKEKGAQSGIDTTALHQKTLELEKQLNDILQQKKHLEDTVLSLTRKLDTQAKTIYAPGTMQAQKQTENVKKIPKPLGTKAGILSPEVPNLISGIVKDARGNILPNMLIEVKDKEGNPVRAFKTNQLGQFASATQLPNGSYTMQFDDPQGKQKFDAIALNIAGEIIPPLEIISTDEREELRRDLFGK